MGNRLFLALDISLALLVAFVSFAARFEGFDWWPALTQMAVLYALAVVPAKIVAFMWVGLYTRLWRYASIADMEIAVAAASLGMVASFAVGLIILPATGLIPTRVPIGILLLDGEG